MRFILLSIALLGLGLTLACGGGSTPPPPQPTGSLTIRLGSDSFPGYSQAFVSIESVEGSTDGSNWIALGSVKATMDLLVLQNGQSAVILPATTVPSLTYSQFRLTWATKNYISPVTSPAFVFPIGAATAQPTTMPTTTVVNGPVTVPTNGNVTMQIMLTGQQLVQSHSVGTYAFQGVGRALDLSACATLKGRALDGTTALAGVEVFAETVDGSGLATLQRRAFTDATGSYVLDGLPAGSLYFVTAQPAVDALHTYGAVAAAVNATTATNYTANLAFSSPQAPGSLTLTITPPSLMTQGTWGELRKALDTGTGGIQTLIVRSQTVATNPTGQDLMGLNNVAPGTYGVTAQRSTSLAAPVMKVTPSQVLVSSGGTATTSLSYP